MCCIVVISVLSGCSAGTPNANKIMSDLNATEFINAADLYGNDKTKTIPVTNVSMLDTKKENKNCRITCMVVQEDENYKKESQLIISYNKIDDWFMDTYNATNVSVMPLSGVPDDIIRNSYEVNGFKNSSNKQRQIEIVNMVHDFNSEFLTDEVSFQCIVTGETCRKTVSLTMKYSFNKLWKCEDSYIETENIEWLVENINGTMWSGSLGFGGVRTVRINNINTDNQTINVDYGTSSLKYNQVCKYSIREYAEYVGSNGKDSQTIVVPLEHDFYNIEITEHGVWCGNYLDKITE